MTISDQTKVSDLTVAELLEFTNYRDTKAQYNAAIKDYAEKEKEILALREQAVNIFPDNEKLAAVTTPFRITSLEQISELVEKTLKPAIESGSVVLMAVALEENKS